MSTTAGKGTQLPNGSLFRLALLATSSGLLFGVDLGSIGAALSGMSQEISLSTVQAEAVVSSAKAGAIAGCIAAGALTTSRGRRFTVALSGVPFIIGPILVIASTSFAPLILGRLTMGLGIGLASVAAPSYLSETVPPAKRGMFEAMYELGIALGFLIASLLNLWIEHIDQQGSCLVGGCWRYQSGVVPLAFAFPVLVAVLLVPESPRWLMAIAELDGAGLLVALEAIRDLGSSGAAERLEAARASSEGGRVELAPSEDDIVCLWDRKHAEAGNPLWSSPSHGRPNVKRKRTWHVLGQMWRDVAAVIARSDHVPAGSQWGLLLAMAAAVLDQACGSTSMLIYAQNLIKQIGVHDRELQDKLSLAIVAAKLLGVILGLMIVNHVSRRALLTWGGALSSACIVVLALGAAWKSLAAVLIGMSFFILVFYSTWGIGYWIVVVEVTAVAGPRISVSCQSVATATLFAAGWLTSLTFVSIASLGPFSLLIYGGVTVLMALYAAFLLPETSGHSLEEVAEEFPSGCDALADSWDEDYSSSSASQ